MAIDPDEIRLGAIVEIQVLDPQGGNQKQRPVVIVGFEGDDEVVWCAITSTFPTPLPRSCVPMPHDPYGHPSTGLNLECVANCTWVDTCSPADVISKRGYLSTKLLNRITSTIESLSED